MPDAISQSDQMDEHCQSRLKEGLDFCDRVKMRVPPTFCRSVCHGNWRKYQKELPAEMWPKLRKPLTDVEKANDELVTVIIPLREHDEQYLWWTLQSARDNSIGNIEFIVICDGFKAKGHLASDCHSITIETDEVIGQRAAMNRAAEIANGKYLFRLDSHCKISAEWDARMKSSCQPGRIVSPVFDALNENTLEPEGRDHSFARIDAKLDVIYVRNWKSLRDRQLEEETMAITGGAWMINKSYYEKLDGCDESLGGHGNMGLEWSLKVWLTGGECILRTDVQCAHLFREKTPFAINVTRREKAKEQLRRQWVYGEDERIRKPLQWLLFKFHNYTSRPMIGIQRIV